MEKFKTISGFLKSKEMTGEDLRSMIADAALLLASYCAHNFDGSKEMTERVAFPLSLFNKILDEVE